MKTKVAAVASVIFGYLAYVLSMAPEQQTPFFAQMIALTPVSWQPYLGNAAKIISLLSVNYAIFRLRNFHPDDAQPPNQVSKP